MNDGVHHDIRLILQKFQCIERTLERVERALVHLDHRSIDIMATVQDFIDRVLPVVQAEDTKIDSLIALVEALKARVDAIVAGTVTPEQQAQLDEIFNAVSDNPDRIQAAIDANTPTV